MDIEFIAFDCDGEHLWGITEDGIRYRVLELHRAGDGTINVTYWLDGDLITQVHREGRTASSRERVYG